MATQESSLRDQSLEARNRREAVSERLSLVVDRPSAGSRALLILPFATPQGEEALGRQIAALVQRRLASVPGLVTGHGLLVATGSEGRRYVPLYHPLADEQAYSCGAIWQATVVLSGSITITPALRWALSLRDVGNRQMLFEDTLVGDAEDLLDAAGDVAITVANALQISLADMQVERIQRRETHNLDALLSYLRGADLRSQHGLTYADPVGARRQFFDALVLDPAFEAPAAALAAETREHPARGAATNALIAAMESAGALGAAALTAVAQVLDSDGSSQHASLLASAVLSQQPNNYAALGLAGQQAYRSGHFGRARQIVQRLMDLNPENSVPYVLLGNLLAAMNRIPGAAIHWEIGLGFDPDQPRVLLRLGSYLATTGEYARAFEVLQRADALGASTADSLYEMGLSAYKLGRLDKAIEALTMAVTINPDLSYVHIALARCYGRLGQDDLSEQHDARALELLPSYWPSALSVGYLALNQGRVEEALRAYTQVASARPDLPEALFGLGIALVANNMLDDGLETLVRAHELAPNDAATLCAVSLTYLRVNMPREARAAVHSAMLLEPENPDVIHCLAEVNQFWFRSGM